jgi:Domain of unknown function (DUF4136)
MKRLASRFTLLLIALALSGCAAFAPQPPQLSGQVTVYHQWPAQQARSYAFETPTTNSLEQQTLASTMAAALLKHGFTPVSGGASPDVIISFSTQLDAKNMRVIDFVRPWDWGVHGWGGYGHYDRRRFHADPFLYNRWHAPLIPVERTITANQRVLKLMMATPQGQRLYEGAIISNGSSAVINDVLPALVDGLMVRFPGESAKSWPVQVPLMAFPAIQ